MFICSFVVLSLSFQFLVCGMCGVLCARKRTGLIVSTFIYLVVLFLEDLEASFLVLSCIRLCSLSLKGQSVRYGHK